MRESPNARVTFKLPALTRARWFPMEALGLPLGNVKLALRLNK
jgi:hypothetical protein